MGERVVLGERFIVGETRKICCGKQLLSEEELLSVKVLWDRRFGRKSLCEKDVGGRVVEVRR